jgi:hypothetical protein
LALYIEETREGDKVRMHHTMDLRKLDLPSLAKLITEFTIELVEWVHEKEDYLRVVQI